MITKEASREGLTVVVKADIRTAEVVSEEIDLNMATEKVALVEIDHILNLAMVETLEVAIIIKVEKGDLLSSIEISKEETMTIIIREAAAEIEAATACREAAFKA